MAIISLTAILIGVILTTSIVITLVTAGIYLLISAAYFFKGRNQTAS